MEDIPQLNSNILTYNLTDLTVNHVELDKCTGVPETLHSLLAMTALWLWGAARRTILFILQNQWCQVHVIMHQNATYATLQKAPPFHGFSARDHVIDGFTNFVLVF